MDLRVPSRREPREDGNVLCITPQSAGWSYVGFEVYTLEAGQELRAETEDMEVCLVLLAGVATVQTSKEAFVGIGKRMGVFEKTPPFSVYVPAFDQYSVLAETKLEVAVCKAPGKGTYPARLITPEEVGVEVRGYGSIERLVHNILPEQKDADSLLVVEVYTPDGHWSSYPPHKHDEDNLPHESYLEETYYHRIEPAQGFAIQRVYSDDRTLDETIVLQDGDAVLVPRGYHPCSAPPGYQLYYLNVMAGPVRTWKFHNDADHEWLMQKRG
ncbi:MULTISPECIES: 5-deoxy-glucuronate isomerase [Brevibacillus]|uniref:5-deoxy-glucuronate isomerase n=1 Tax=Brevibacillus TaxID=55080 RepID=UPI0026053A72|nr:5-deoxy-glucuronate isomerase [Brevibacillus nitrificans]